MVGDVTPARQSIDLSALREKLAYDAETGVFLWKSSGSNVRANGSAAGTLRHDGYIQIKVLGQLNQAHRLAWFYSYGVWPTTLDHINGLRADNRLANLREVSAGGNLRNQRRPQRHNKAGFLGVSPCRGRFLATIVVNKRQLRLGYFATPEEAHEVYVRAKRIHHPEGTL